MIKRKVAYRAQIRAFTMISMCSKVGEENVPVKQYQGLLWIFYTLLYKFVGVNSPVSSFSNICLLDILSLRVVNQVNFLSFDLKVGWRLQRVLNKNLKFKPYFSNIKRVCRLRYYIWQWFEIEANMYVEETVIIWTTRDSKGTKVAQSVIRPPFFHSGKLLPMTSLFCNI